MTAPAGNYRITPQAVLGLLLLVVGVLLTLDNLDLVESERILRFWPLGIVAAGLVKIAQSSDTSGRTFGAVIVLVGAVWTGESAYDLPIDLSDLWSVGLIALGIVIITRARRSPARDPEVASVAGDAEVSEVAVWAGKQRRNSSPAFRRADLTAVMGGIEFDLRGASTATGEAVIDVFCMWGGIEIYVPPDWAVSNQVMLLMAGAEDKTTGTQDARHRLIVRGFVLMGGVEIKP
jgi:predicted membrane protein